MPVSDTEMPSQSLQPAQGFAYVEFKSAKAGRSKSFFDVFRG